MLTDDQDGVPHQDNREMRLGYEPKLIISKHKKHEKFYQKAIGPMLTDDQDGVPH